MRLEGGNGHVAVIRRRFPLVLNPRGRLSRRYDRCYPSFRRDNPGWGRFAPEGRGAAVDWCEQRAEGKGGLG